MAKCYKYNTQLQKAADVEGKEMDSVVSSLRPEKSLRADYILFVVINSWSQDTCGA